MGGLEYFEQIVKNEIKIVACGTWFHKKWKLKKTHYRFWKQTSSKCYYQLPIISSGNFNEVQNNSRNRKIPQHLILPEYNQGVPEIVSCSSSLLVKTTKMYNASKLYTG